MEILQASAHTPITGHRQTKHAHKALPPAIYTYRVVKQAGVGHRRLRPRRRPLLQRECGGLPGAGGRQPHVGRTGNGGRRGRRGRGRGSHVSTQGGDGGSGGDSTRKRRHRLVEEREAQLLEFSFVSVRKQARPWGFQHKRQCA